MSFVWGTPVPAGGQVAAGLLSLEMAKALAHDSSCKLPQRWQSITRQGVTITAQDLFEDLNEGRTGLWLVDSWVASVTQPKRVGGRVFSPDIPRTGRAGATMGPGVVLVLDGGSPGTGTGFLLDGGGP